MAKDEYVPFTGKLDAAPQFEPFDGTLDGEKPKEPGFAARLGQGASRALDSAKTALTDDPNKIAQIAAEQARTALPQSDVQRKMAEEFAPYVEEANKAEGVVDNVKAWGAAGFKRAGQLVSNPGETAKMIAEQLPNSLPGLAGGVAGAKAGAALGSLAGPVGTAVGGVLGGVAGGIAGGYGLEKGAAMQDQVQKEAQAQRIDLQDESAVARMVALKQSEFDAAAQRKGVGTAGADALLNVATMGLAGVGGRALAKEARALSDAVQAGKISAADASTTLARLQAENAARNTLGAQAKRGAGVAGAEMVGEGVSEGVGQKFAYGSVDAGEVIDESLLGLGTGGAMALGNKAFNKAAGIVNQDAITRDLEAAGQGLANLGTPSQYTGQPPQPGPVLGLPAPDRGVIEVASDGTARTPAYQAPGYVGDVTDVEPKVIDPVREQVAAAAEQGGALSSAALTAIDTGLSDAMQPAPEQAPPQISLEEADARDRAAYEQFFAGFDADPVVSRYFENDDDIPDFDAASNASEEDFLRALGATDEDIQDAIATSSQSAIPQSSAASNAGPQAYEPAGPREGAGEGAASQTGQVNAGAIQQAAPDAPVPGVGGQVGADGAGSAAAAVSGASGPGGAGTGAATGSGAGATEVGSARAGGRGDSNQALSAPTNLRDALVRVRQQKQEAANAQAAQAPVPAAAPVPGPAATAVEAAGLNRPKSARKAAEFDARKAAEIEAGALGAQEAEAAGVPTQVTWPAHRKWVYSQAPRMTLREFQVALKGRHGMSGPEIEAYYKSSNGGAEVSAAKITTEGAANGPQASQAQQASPQPTQAAAPAAAAGLTDGAPTANTGAQAAPAPGPQGAAPAEPEFTTIKTVYGDSVTVRTADLNGNKQRLRQYTKDGKSKAVPAIHRDNLDLTGDKRKASAKEDADNPFFNVITTKDGSTFASQAAASRELNRLAMGETHEVVAASEVQDGAQGFVIRRKPVDAMAGRAETGGQQPAAPAAAELTLDEQLKQVNDQLANQGQVKNANTRAKRDQVRTAIAERDFPAILKAVDGDIDSAEAINQALQYAGDEPKAKVIERVLKNRGITAEYRQRWAERLMGEEGANNAVPAPPPGVVNVPPAIAAALDADMQAQKARITRLRNAATAEGMSLEEKKQAQTQLKGAEFTLQTMRRTRFDAEDAAIKAIEQKDMAPFAEHITFFKTEKALQELIGAAKPPAAAPATKKKPNADKTRAKADLMAALADLGDILGKNTRMNIMPEQEQKLLPVLTRLLDAAFRLGYHKFKDSAKFALDQIRANLGDDAADALTLDHLQGAYIAMAGGKDGVDSKRAVIDVETKAEIEAHTVVDPDAETDATIKPTMATADGRRAIAQTVADHMIGGNKFATINDARKFIEGITDSRIPPGTKQAKLADETVEVGVAIAARDIVSSGRKAGRTDEQIFNRLVSLYEAQPSLNVRDTDSLREQAYSTPAPLAFVASRLAKVGTTDKVGEPTGGNGMLLMEVAQQNAVVNELNDDRAGNLRAAGFEVTQNNAATSALAPAKSLDALVMNPPFGAVRDESGSTVTYTILPEYSTGEIDHAIVFKSLESMKDDGNAVLIIGGTLAESEQGRKEAYRGRAKRQFFFNLQQQYNVVDHFTVGGDLYKKQGTTYPVDVIVIRGRGQSARALPAADLPPIITTWAQLQEKLNGNNDGMGASRPGITGSNPSANGNSPEQSAVLEPAGPTAQADGQGIQPAGSQDSVRADGAVQPDGAVPGRNPSATNDAVGQPGNEAQVDRTGRSGGIPGASATQQQTGANGTGERDAAGVGDGDSRSAGRARLSEEDAGKLQVKYQSFSGNKSVNTLVATNHLSALESAFDNLRKRVGNIDDYVRNSLQYSPEGFKKAFSAEQVEALALAIDNIERGRGFIIGDQTGIGKGRVVAAMIRYAKLNGKTPVFVTQMPDLYGDMMRDLNDIGMTDFKPLMTNNNAEVPLDAEALSWFGEVQAINTRVKELESAIEEILMGEGAADAGVKGVKASVNPEVVSLRDEIAELKASKPARTGKFLETPNIERHERDLAEFVKRGNIGDYGAIFTTYNQMAALDSGKPRRDKSGVKKDAAPPKFAYRNEFLQAMVNNNAMLILDESHNAGSAGDGKFPKVGDVVRLLVRKAGSVFYSSATFAKNPSVMDVYSKTDLGQAFTSADQLSAALSSVPQQQVASSMLVENGQYIRRERSFDGIEYKIQEVESDTQAAEDVSTAMRLVVEFDDAKKAAVNALKDDMDAQGATIAAAGGGGSLGSVDSTNFTSVMHNVINTFLLSLKADAAADVAIAAIKAGEKPVLTVANTMEMFIRDYAESAGLSAGDRLNATFGDVLMRYLEKTRKVRITGPNGDSETKILTAEELGPDGVAAYESAREFIASLNLEIPLSPIDHIKERIADAGYSIGEVTGRQSVVERGVIRPRNKAEMNTAGKKNTIAKFNGGQLDALIINRSGSTGLSMHASETFPDQRRRVMVVAQAELDINNHMQMLGRTNRTGQVTANGKSPAQNAIYGLPRYVQLTANVPIELRPAAVLAAKMASLSANTTAGRKSAVEDSSAPDFMNKYGDEVAALVVGNDPELNKRLGYPISIDMNGVPETLNAISKVTGRIGLLPLREQKAIYDRITNDYRDLIAQLDALGKNDLEAKTYALDAKTLESTEVIAGDGDSVFNAPVVAEKVDVKKLGKPYSSEKVKQLVEESLGGLTPAQHRNQLMEMFRKEANAEVDAARLKAAGDKNGPAAIQQRMDSLNAAFTRFRSIVPTLGSPVVIKTSSNGNIYGIPISIQRKKGSQSVGALSAWVVKYAVVDGSRVMGFPLSQVFSTDNGKLTDSSVVVEPATVMNLPNEERTGFVEVPVLEAFDRGQTDSREVRYVMTGNLLRAGGKFSGRLISYTTADGDVRQGLLTPVTFDLKAAQAKMTPELTNPQQMVEFLDAGGQIVDRETGGDIVNVRKTHRYEVTTAKAGKGRKIAMEGGLYMASSGTRMRGNVSQQNAADLIPFFEKVVGTLNISLTTTPSTKDLVPGGASASFSRAPSATPTTAQPLRTPAATIRAAITKAYGKLLGQLESKGLVTLTQTEDEAIEAAAQARAAKTGGDVEAIKRSMINAMQGETGLDVKRSSNGSIQGFFDPQTGQSFLIADNLTAEAAPGVLMHEVGIHMAADGSMKALFNRAAMMLKLQRGNPFMKAVQDRMDAAGETSGEEAAAYIAEAYENDRANAPASVQRWLADLLAAVKAWMFKKGIMGADRLTVADIAAVARANARSMARDGGATGGQGFGTAFSRAPAGDQTQTDAFKRWFKDSKVVDADGKPLRVFHGTGADFSEFSASKIGSAWGADTVGFFFTDSAKTASSYATSGGPTLQRDEGANIIPAYIRISRPVTVEALEAFTGESGLADAYESPIELMDERRDDIMSMLLGNEQDDWSIDKDSKPSVNNTHDGVIFSFGGSTLVVAVDPAQIKSAIGNSGAFDPANPDIRFSRAGMADLARKARDELNRTFTAPGKLSWWHKTVGTMYNLAERSPAFKRVFDAAQGFVDDVSYYATDAAEQAPRLLPKLETWRDIAKRPITAADNAAVAKPVFEGTLVWTRDEAGKPVRVDDLVAAAEKLTAEEKARSLLRQDKISAGMLRAWQGLPLEQYEKLVESRYESQMLKAGIVWTPAELKSMFKLTDDQVALYKEFRAATDRSLDTMARSDMLRYGGKDVADLRDMVMDAADAQDAAQILRDHLQMLAKENPERAGELGQLSSGMLDRAAKVQELQEQGYAPLSRFGKYTVDVVDANGERQYFGLFETQREANIMAMKMRKGYGQDAVSQGTLSNEEFKLLAGITPESLELFGNMLGLDSTGDDAQDQAFQEYLRRTKTNRSAMRRLIHRQGIAGYSEDVGRVLASFIYSNARQTSAGLHMGELGEAITAIPKQQGELKDAAIQLSEYVKNPQEEAQAVRGLLFAQYLGGSIASAVVNMSQPAAVTFPWLSQFGGARQAAAELGRAAKNLANKGHRYEADLAAALKHAEEEGTVSPQEVHQLMAQARGSGSLRPGDGTRTGDALASAGNARTRLSLAWGKVFGAAEQVNRRMTYIAAFRIAKAQKMANPAAFAKKAVIETQFTYSKANKMKWGRGAVGATAMTFKTYSIAYLELLGRMWTQGEPGSQERKDGRKAVLLALGMLMLMGGAGGLPFAEDAEDLVDGLAQLAGYNFNSKKAKQELLESVFGQAGAGFVERGITGLPGMPLDVSGRLGMGNLLPGTGIFKEKTDHTRDVLEVVGPVGDLAKRVASGTRSILEGDVGAGLLQMAPTAVRNAAKGRDMAITGMYRDDKGYKVLDTSPAEAAMKAIGFQPASVAKVQEANFINQQAKNFYNMKAQEIRAKWARGIFEKDQGIVAEARADLEEWNRKNPEQRIVVSMPAVLKRVREMSKTKDQRIADTAPRAMRQQMREETEKARATL